MSSQWLIIGGIACVLLSVGLLVCSIVYLNTAGKRIRNELQEEYWEKGE